MIANNKNIKIINSVLIHVKYCLQKKANKGGNDDVNIAHKISIYK